MGFVPDLNKYVTLNEKRRTKRVRTLIDNHAVLLSLVLSVIYGSALRSNRCCTVTPLTEIRLFIFNSIVHIYCYVRFEFVWERYWKFYWIWVIVVRTEDLVILSHGHFAHTS
jgi:hypothetical protein